MAKYDNPGIWEQIQRGVQETERLIGQKKYNLSMMKARETLEYMIQLLAEKADINERTAEKAVRALYQSQALKKSTAERYLEILDFGKKADLEGHDSAYDADRAFQILSQEIHAFVDVDKDLRSRRTSSRQQPRPQSRRRSSSGSSGGLRPSDLVKLLIPIVLVVVLLLVIKVLSPKKEATAETTTPPAVTQEQPTEAPTEAPTEPETTAASTVAYKTTTTLNVRSGPSTESQRIGKLDPGKTVQFLRDHDDFWAVILYNEQEAYVAKEYLTLAE